MSYTPTTWSTGDTITVEKMNQIEQGIKNGTTEYETITYTQNGVNSCYNDVINAYENGRYKMLENDEPNYYCLMAVESFGNFNNSYFIRIDGDHFIASSANDEFHINIK